MEQNDEWTEARSYMGLEVLAKIGGSGAPISATDAPEEVNAIQAISA